MTMTMNGAPRARRMPRRRNPFAALLRNPAVPIVAGVIAFLALWAAAIAFFGYPALIVPLLALVPAVVTILVLFTRG